MKNTTSDGQRRANLYFITGVDRDTLAQKEAEAFDKGFGLGLELGKAINSEVKGNLNTGGNQNA